MDRRERLHLEQPRHGDRTGPGHRPQVVAQQVDDHQVLGAVLLARRQLSPQRRVSRGGRAARPGALDRPRLDGAVRADQQEPLGRAAQHRQIAEPQVCPVRHRLAPPQRPVGRPRIEVARHRDRVGQADLIRLAGPDLRLARRDQPQVVVPAVPRRRRPERAAEPARLGRPTDIREPGPRLVQPGVRVIGLTGRGEGEQVDISRRVVERDRPVRELQERVRIRRRVLAWRPQLVPEVPDPAERELERQPSGRHPVPGQVILQPAEQLAGTGHIAHCHRAVVHRRAGDPRRRAKEREPPAAAAVQPERELRVAIPGVEYRLGAGGAS